MPKYMGKEIELVEASGGMATIRLVGETATQKVRLTSIEGLNSIAPPAVKQKEKQMEATQTNGDTPTPKSKKAPAKGKKAPAKGKAKKVPGKAKVTNGDEAPMSALRTKKDVYIKGQRSVICGDDVSQVLDGLDPAQKVRVAYLLTKDTDKPVKISEWDHLNNGQRAMNAANRIRGLLNQEETTVTAIKAAVKSVLA